MVAVAIARSNAVSPARGIPAVTAREIPAAVAGVAAVGRRAVEITPIPLSAPAAAPAVGGEQTPHTPQQAITTRRAATRATPARVPARRATCRRTADDPATRITQRTACRATLPAATTHFRPANRISAHRAAHSVPQPAASCASRQQPPHHPNEDHLLNHLDFLVCRQEISPTLNYIYRPQGRDNRENR